MGVFVGIFGGEGYFGESKMIRITGIRLPVDYKDGDIIIAAAKKLKIGAKMIEKCSLRRLSTDARDKRDVHFSATVDLTLKSVADESAVLAKSRCKNAAVANDTPYVYMKSAAKKRVVVVGSGPAGLFCAYTLAKSGLCPIVVERGSKIEKRVDDVERFHSHGVLNLRSNVQFGEGGAGTFSDGKLNTGIKDIRIREVLNTFVKFGAPSEILWLAKPHIGTDMLRRVIVNMRNEIIALGGEFNFDTTLCDIEICDGKVHCAVLEHEGNITQLECDDIVLCIGHSARDTFYMLKDKPIELAQKPFAVGVRIEHKQQMINRAQYGDFAGVGRLNAADYKLAVHLPSGRGVYTFCMCPGGYVVAAASESGMVAVNGMSNFARDGENANSAVLVGVDTADFGSDDVLAGVEFQRKIEQNAYSIAGKNYSAPAQTLGSFLYGKDCAQSVSPTYRPNVTMCDISGIFPQFVTESLKYGIIALDKKLHGFADEGAIITAPETRSSSPVRVLRGADFQADISGLYPCGEGAGYAGGITSAAVDGMKCAESIIGKYSQTV